MVRQIDDTNLTSGLPPVAHRTVVADLSLFYRYLKSIISLKLDAIIFSPAISNCVVNLRNGFVLSVGRRLQIPTPVIVQKTERWDTKLTFWGSWRSHRLSLENHFEPYRNVSILRFLDFLGILEMGGTRTIVRESRPKNINRFSYLQTKEKMICIVLVVQLWEQFNC